MFQLQIQSVGLLLHVVHLGLVPLLQRSDDLFMVLLRLQDGFALLKIRQLLLQCLYHQLRGFQLRHKLKFLTILKTSCGYTALPGMIQMRF